MPLPVFEKEIRVQYSYCDSFNRMTLSYLLKEAQEISMQHCDQLGLSNAFLASLGKVFLLAKLHVTVHDMPKGGQIVRIATIPYLPVRLQYPRFTRVYDREGTLLAEVDSRWMLVDIESRRIVRRPPEDLPLPFPQIEGLGDFKFPKLADEDLRPAGRIRVQYSMADTNRHLNNAVYADLACNQAEEELMAGKTIKSLSLFYHHEARFGEEMELSSYREGKTFYLRGQLPACLCFESELVL